MHEEANIPVVAADGQEAGGLAGHDLVLEAGRRPERRGRRAVQLGEVRRQLGLDVGGDVRQVKGIVYDDAGRIENLGDLLVRGRLVGEVLGVRVGLADLEQHGVDVDRLAVDRDAHQQGRGSGYLVQPGQEIVQQHVVGGQGYRLG